MEKLDRKHRTIIEENIAICKQKCNDCEENDEIEEDQKVFERLKVDRDSELFGSSKAANIHFIIPTSQVNWKHDACGEREGSVQDQIAKWIEKKGQLYEGTTMRCNVTSLSMDILDLEVMQGRKNNILIFPHFVKLVDIKSEDVEEILDELVPLLLKGDLERVRMKSYAELCIENAFVFICSHTTRDTRCGKTAPILIKHFNQHLKNHGLYRDDSDFRPNGCKVVCTNHIGGHKFAANVIIYLRKSWTVVWLGRVSPIHVESIVKNLIIPDIPQLPFPENVRCVKRYEF